MQSDSLVANYYGLIITKKTMILNKWLWLASGSATKFLSQFCVTACTGLCQNRYEFSCASAFCVVQLSS